MSNTLMYDYYMPLHGDREVYGGYKNYEIWDDLSIVFKSTGWDEVRLYGPCIGDTGWLTYMQFNAHPGWILQRGWLDTDELDSGWVRILLPFSDFKEFDPVTNPYPLIIQTRINFASGPQFDRNIVNYGPAVNLHYRVTAYSDYNRFDHMGFINRITITTDAYKVTDRFYKINISPKVVYDSSVINNITLNHIMHYETDTASSFSGVKVKNEPYTLLPDEPITANVPYITTRRNNSSTDPYDTIDNNGEYLWVLPVNSSNPKTYEEFRYTVKVNGSTVDQLTNGWRYRIADESQIDYQVISNLYYYGVLVSTESVTDSFETLKYSMYIDKDSLGFGTVPEDNCITFDTFNLYEPGYTDCTYPLLCMREAETYARDFYSTHTLMFTPDSPVVENGTTVTVSGKLTYLQYLANQTPSCYKLPPGSNPAIECKLSDGSGTVWSIPSTANWNCVGSYVMAEYKCNADTNEVRLCIEHVWEVNTTITIDTTLQSDVKSVYEITYADLRDYNPVYMCDYYNENKKYPEMNINFPEMAWRVDWGTIPQLTISELSCTAAEDIEPCKGTIRLFQYYS